jgi:hypothetical protein
MAKKAVGGVKFDQGKPEMDLLPREALVEIAKGFGFGAVKYGRFNWRNGLKWSRVYSALNRHLAAWNAGEDFDPESGLNHLAHAGCNLMFLLTYLEEHPELDDRYGKEAQRKEKHGKHPKREAKKKKKRKA